MDRNTLIQALADEVTARKRVTRPLLVGIDGRCASGKTTLADELATAIGARHPALEILRPSIDGFHQPREYRYRQGEFSPRGYYEDAYNYELLIESLLRPLSGDTFPVFCRQVCHDWRTDMPSEAAPIAVGANAVLLFEGIFVLRRRLNAFWDLRLLVEVDSQTSIRRAVARDATDFGSQEAALKKCRLRYEPAWQLYAEAEHPEQKADLIVHNEDVLHPALSRRPASAYTRKDHKGDDPCTKP